ncbi:radical SAM family heme chaperone HemW [Methylococcus sp. EFPC2]|uniref:radical SAM family heme chaperone HemW n=1 Tax=Methylococcus sp. EFPC2 TaxID=2812648 RepID=UPI001967BC44|nr:radical SAM family heme chaperone HemW [Methylococcus sp. EFPC2]QSA96958.1 radical SAM family heme chaperone HemW [Methylococcus sp. EFPC2]
MLHPPPLGLYIHIPWCVRKCPYCDFNSHAANDSVSEQAYVSALLADLDQDLPLAAGRTVETIFIGGGTPSLFSALSIDELLEGVAQRLALAPDIEITLEANPGTAESARFEGYRAAGVNRLSIGVQSFDEAHLQRLGRIHGREEAINAAYMAREAGFENFNLDLMFGLPDQTTEQALVDIETALSLKPTHLSFYQLTLEPNTLFHKYPPPLPGDEAIWEIQGACQRLLVEHGYAQYEVSAYAQAGRRCRHNLNYWQFGDYLGIGAGAHGKLTDPITGRIARRWKVRHPTLFLEHAGRPASIGGHDFVEPAELPVEFLMNHLRLREGFPEAAYAERTGLDNQTLQPGLNECIEAGLIERCDGRIRCTETGWNFLDNVLERFLGS